MTSVFEIFKLLRAETILNPRICVVDAQAIESCRAEPLSRLFARVSTRSTFWHLRVCRLSGIF